MRKRLSAGILAVSAALVMSGATPAAAYDDDQRDRHPPVPCNPYPPGKKFHVFASPTSATVRKGAHIDSVASVYRGEGSDRKPCKFHLVILRYASDPNRNQKAHRTEESGKVGFVLGPVNSKLTYYYLLLYNNTYYASNRGVITPR